MTGGRGRFTGEQVEVLLRPIKPQRVYEANGQCHVPIFEDRAHLNRLFGFDGWDEEIVHEELVFEEPRESKGRTGWWVTYRCRVRLTIYSPDGRVAKVSEGSATGSAQNLPSRGDAHDFALKTAQSYAFKRACVGLGDQFGLSLYNHGSRSALVGRTLVDRAGGPEPAADIDSHVEQVDGEGVEPVPTAVTVEEERAADRQRRATTAAASAPEALQKRRTGTPGPVEDEECGGQPAAAETQPKAGLDGSHLLDGILALVDPRPVRARSILLREAIGVARDLGLDMPLGWDDLRGGPVCEALIERYTGDSR